MKGGRLTKRTASFNISLDKRIELAEGRLTDDKALAEFQAVKQSYLDSRKLMVDLLNQARTSNNLDDITKLQVLGAAEGIANNLKQLFHITIQSSPKSRWFKSESGFTGSLKTSENKLREAIAISASIQANKTSGMTSDLFMEIFRRNIMTNGGLKISDAAPILNPTGFSLVEGYGVVTQETKAKILTAENAKRAEMRDRGIEPKIADKGKIRTEVLDSKPNGGDKTFRELNPPIIPMEVIHHQLTRANILDPNGRLIAGVPTMDTLKKIFSPSMTKEALISKIGKEFDKNKSQGTNITSPDQAKIWLSDAVGENLAHHILENVALQGDDGNHIVTRLALENAIRSTYDTFDDALDPIHTALAGALSNEVNEAILIPVMDALGFAPESFGTSDEFFRKLTQGVPPMILQNNAQAAVMITQF
ncbi:MAG: hypothetical protein HRT90_09580, partial [Candidatus Margulisbacteria bacterium]|nr:hypothetical protein [Candidatus Margulisiibacteriota bacterium]